MGAGTSFDHEQSLGQGLDSGCFVYFRLSSVENVSSDYHFIIERNIGEATSGLIQESPKPRACKELRNSASLPPGATPEMSMR